MCADCHDKLQNKIRIRAASDKRKGKIKDIERDKLLRIASLPSSLPSLLVGRAPMAHTYHFSTTQSGICSYLNPIAGRIITLR